ncbi:MAG TPA: hypothetical protein VLA28_08840 [Afifellaceae bacterium]|nr:hypothetical protein [Afifellaceae bacterium]
MKTIILAAMASVFVAGTAMADTPLVDKRQHGQAHRIYNGVQSGELTFRETGQLLRGHGRILHKERQFKSDGVVTPAERAKLFRMQTRQDVRIYRKKHN